MRVVGVFDHVHLLKDDAGKGWVSLGGDHSEYRVQFLRDDTDRRDVVFMQYEQVFPVRKLKVFGTCHINLLDIIRME